MVIFVKFTDTFQDLEGIFWCWFINDTQKVTATVDDVAQSVERLTGIPVSKMGASDIERLRNIESRSSLAFLISASICLASVTVCCDAK